MEPQIAERKPYPLELKLLEELARVFYYSVPLGLVIGVVFFRMEHPWAMGLALAGGLFLLNALSFFTMVALNNRYLNRLPKPSGAIPTRVRLVVYNGQVLSCRSEGWISVQSGYVQFEGLAFNLRIQANHLKPVESHPELDPMLPWWFRISTDKDQRTIALGLGGRYGNPTETVEWGKDFLSRLQTESEKETDEPEIWPPKERASFYHPFYIYLWWAISICVLIFLIYSIWPAYTSPYPIKVLASLIGIAIYARSMWLGYVSAKKERALLDSQKP